MDLSSVLVSLLALIPGQYALYVLALCGLCAVVAALWKKPAEGSPWLALYLVVNALGANFLHAQNHSGASVPSSPTHP